MKNADEGIVKGIWIVTQPTDESVLSDIMFWADGKKLASHFNVGMKPASVIGFHERRDAAMEHARNALAKRDNDLVGDLDWSSNRRAVLVYQGGIANVFEVRSFNLADFGREARRLIQGDFSACANFARGLRTAGWTVKVAACNQVGDVAKATWSENLEEQPFSDKFQLI